MSKKNQSTPNKKDVPRNQKKPLPKPDPKLRQVMYKRIAPKQKK